MVRTIIPVRGRRRFRFWFGFVCLFSIGWGGRSFFHGGGGGGGSGSLLPQLKDMCKDARAQLGSACGVGFRVNFPVSHLLARSIASVPRRWHIQCCCGALKSQLLLPGADEMLLGVHIPLLFFAACFGSLKSWGRFCGSFLLKDEMNPKRV